MRRTSVSYQEMYKKVKQQLARDRKLIFASRFFAVVTGASACAVLALLASRSRFQDHTRISGNDASHARKIIRLSHQITDVLVESEEVEFVDDRDTFASSGADSDRHAERRREDRTGSAQADHFAEKRDPRRQRGVDVLHKKYYQDELRRMGIAAAPTTAIARSLSGAVDSPHSRPGRNLRFRVSSDLRL